MTNKEFDKKFHGVISPKCRGAAYPKFDPAGINESKFEDDCRYKECDIDFNSEHGIVKIDWTTQSNCSCHKMFVEELVRCFKHIGFDGLIKLRLHDRDGYDDFYEEIACC